MDEGDVADRLPFFTMPFVEGESRGSVHRTRRTSDRTSFPSCATSRALAHAHARGVMHRDIKPDNVLLTGGSAVVSDFGVAKAIGASTSESGLTSVGVALGTPAYMAPEQAAADPNIDQRADLYAFGVLAFELLTGHTPFAGRSAGQMLAAHATVVPLPVAEDRPTTPPALAQLVMRCLEKRPADRPSPPTKAARARRRDDSHGRNRSQHDARVAASSRRDRGRHRIHRAASAVTYRLRFLTAPTSAASS
jgi:serine/threonine-protein kinase